MAEQPMASLTAMALGDEVETSADVPIGTVKTVLADRFEVAAIDEDIWLSNAAVQRMDAGRVTLVCGLEALPEYIVRDASPSPMGREVRA